MSEETQAENVEDVLDIEAEEVVEPAEVTEEPVDEVVVSIGDESPPPEEQEPAQAPAWVKELRKNHRDLQKKNRELEDKLRAATPAELKVELGAKPKLEDLDFDPERYENELSKWYERKRVTDEAAAKVRETKEQEEKAWQGTLKAYEDAKFSLKVPDFEEAEHVAVELLSKTQQGIILQGAENPALVVYALGRNSAKAKELAAITDPVRYAFAVAKLETQLRITKRSAPAPEKTISSKGGASFSGALDSTLDKLRTEAERTGDYSKVHEYKRLKKK